VERLTVSLDDESFYSLNEYAHKNKCTRSAVVKKALQLLTERFEIELTCNKEQLKAYCDFLLNKDHIILDIDHWKCFFKEIGEGSDTFWKEVYDIGVEHQEEYFTRGLRNVHDILRFVEKTNWYILNQDSENDFTLILNINDSSRFVETFFKGFFSKYPQKVAIAKGTSKIRIKIENKN
jgi:hypothetical protein